MLLDQSKKSVLLHLRCAPHSRPAKKHASIGRRVIMIGIIALATLPTPAFTQILSNSAFNIRYGAGGITSLKRVNDKYDTEYLSVGGTLGNIVIQYRTSTNNGW